MSIAGLVLPNFSFAQEQFGAAMPQSLGEAKDFITSVLQGLPDAVKRVWNEEALPVWQRMWTWFIDIWNRTLGPIAESWWQKFLGLLGKEVEKRSSDIKQQFQEEKTEMQKDLWERFKDLWK